MSDDVVDQPLAVGRIQLAHRVVMAPLTRCRALGEVPCSAAAQYYAQRATPGGLIIAEGTLVSAHGHGYPCTPGVYTAEQMEAWRPIVKAVKDKGAFFYLQIWHCGRASHRDYQPNGELPVSPSAIAINGQVYSPKQNCMVDYEAPRALEAGELPAIVQEFRQAARNAIDVGFDGVEIHGANGYLLNQFLCDGMNHRQDEYGGELENRSRFPLEVRLLVSIDRSHALTRARTHARTLRDRSFSRYSRLVATRSVLIVSDTVSPRYVWTLCGRRSSTLAPSLPHSRFALVRSPVRGILGCERFRPSRDPFFLRQQAARGWPAGIHTFCRAEDRGQFRRGPWVQVPGAVPFTLHGQDGVHCCGRIHAGDCQGGSSRGSCGRSGVRSLVPFQPRPAPPGPRRSRSEPVRSCHILYPGSSRRVHRLQVP